MNSKKNRLALGCVILMSPLCSGAASTYFYPTTPNAAPVTPPTYTPSQTQFSNVTSSAVCGGQYANQVALDGINAQIQTEKGLKIQEDSLNLNYIQTAAAAEQLTQASFDLAASKIPLAPFGIAADSGVTAAASLVSNAGSSLAFAVANDVFAGAGLATQIAGNGYIEHQEALTNAASSLPLCDTNFNGTVSIQKGGLNVTDDSIFNDNLSIGKGLDVKDGIQANTVAASKNITAGNGNITIGALDGQTYSGGITIGGGNRRCRDGKWSTGNRSINR